MTETTEDSQVLARRIRDGDLERYKEWADAAAPHMKPGDVNWPMMVRSLVAEVERLKVECIRLGRDGHEAMTDRSKTTDWTIAAQVDSCATCRYWHRDQAGYIYGMCRRWPPRAGLTIHAAKAHSYDRIEVTPCRPHPSPSGRTLERTTAVPSTKSERSTNQ